MHSSISTPHIVQHTTSHNPSKEENTLSYDKHHIPHLAIIHVSSYNIKSNYPHKICQVFGFKDHFRQSLSLILQL